MLGTQHRPKLRDESGATIPEHVRNYGTHKHPGVREWFVRHPEYVPHFTPTSSSWLNQVERFFAQITERRIRRGAFKSVGELEQAIEDYLRWHNKQPRPFIWTKNADVILNKVRKPSEFFFDLTDRGRALWDEAAPWYAGARRRGPTLPSLQEWVDRVTPVGSISLDIAFVISDSFYYGPANFTSAEQRQQLREPLYKPQVERYQNYVLSEALRDSTAELLRYYQDVLQLCARHRKQVSQESTYFWIWPLIFVRDVFNISFPWYGTWDEATRLLDSLGVVKDGRLFDDQDQGWEVEVYAAGQRLFFRHSDPDSKEEYCVISADRSEVLRQIPEVRERVERILRKLSEAVGQNYWSQSYWRH